MMRWMKQTLAILVYFGTLLPNYAQEPSSHSVARQWNDVLLEAIRNDYAKPTIHARNLFHISAATYDAWSAFESSADTYFLNKTVGNYFTPFNDFLFNGTDIRLAQETAISYAIYRLIEHRYRNSPGYATIIQRINTLMAQLGYDINLFSTDYTSGDPAALGNYIAEQVITFGLQDGANELGDYLNAYYQPINSPLLLSGGVSKPLTDPNRWQPLQFEESFIDQSGNPVSSGTIDFLSPEWGEVLPFSLTEADRVIRERDEQTYKIYLDPGPPPYLDSVGSDGLADPYKWGFALVSVWQGMLDTENDTLIDISPNSIGNLSLNDPPQSSTDYANFYKLTTGGDVSGGYTQNPVTEQPYSEQWVLRGDYGRVLAEFWADGPDSETPPGHWYTILNAVVDHPLFERKMRGEGEELSALEWDVKAYFALGGALHDAAVSAWSIKGFYDYIRPISAIRYMGSQGQSSDANLPNYSPKGLPLIEGWIELVGADDLLVGDSQQYLNQIKLYSWRGHDFVNEDASNAAGAGWILAKDWWPYQRPSFVTPPFAGYVSGHSTFSRAAAEVLTLLTGSEYFPGGVGEFTAKQDEYLVFEKGPSQDVVLQWAKYYDASDQCSLSRIWGGIHPPADDIPGRKIGSVIGKQAFALAEQYFTPKVLGLENSQPKSISIHPNPVETTATIRGAFSMQTPPKLLTILGKEVSASTYSLSKIGSNWQLNLQRLPSGMYLLIDTSGRTSKLLKK